MKISYNLLDNEWIPVLTKDGHIRDVSLRELLIRAHEFREIAHDSPLFVASVLALSVALLQSAWPHSSYDERDMEWDRVWELGRFDAAILESYFAQWHGRFDLFDAQFPFYQTANLTMAETSPLSRLALEEQNAPPLFANAANPDWSAPSPALAAQLLLCIQNFALGFGKSSRAKIGDEAIEPPYSKDGPLLRGLTIWPSGATWFETLMLNLVPDDKSKADKPCWELDEPYQLRDVTVNGGRKTEKERGICDLLTLQCRLIRLLPVELNGKIAVPNAYLTQGRSLEKGDGVAFHPLKLYVESQLTGFAPISLSENKAIWRNSAALLSQTNRKRDKRNTLAFVARQLENRTLNSDFRAGLNVVGMATDPGKAAKFLLWRHDRLPLPATLLLDPNTELRVQSAIKDADDLADEMRSRFATVARTMVMPEKLSGHSPDPDDVKNLVNKFDPRRSFWPVLENHFLKFLKDLADPNGANDAIEQWCSNIEKVANNCFRDSCNALGKGPNAVVAVAQVYPLFSLEYMRKRPARSTAK